MSLCEEDAPREPLKEARGASGLQGAANKETSNESLADEMVQQSGQVLTDPRIVAGVLEIIAIIWATSALRLAHPDNQKYLEALRNKTARALPLLFANYKVI